MPHLFLKRELLVSKFIQKIFKNYFFFPALSQMENQLVTESWLEIERAISGLTKPGRELKRSGEVASLGGLQR
jgi:hypothetical protein